MSPPLDLTNKCNTTCNGIIVSAWCSHGWLLLIKIGTLAKARLYFLWSRPDDVSLSLLYLVPPIFLPCRQKRSQMMACVSLLDTDVEQRTWMILWDPSMYSHADHNIDFCPTYWTRSIPWSLSVDLAKNNVRLKVSLRNGFEEDDTDFSDEVSSSFIDLIILLPLGERGWKSWGEVEAWTIARRTLGDSLLCDRGISSCCWCFSIR